MQKKEPVVTDERYQTMKKKTYKKVAIIGLGLIGGSLGAALKKYKLAHCISGWFRKRSRIRSARVQGLIDEGTTDLKKAVDQAELIILAAPIAVNIELGKALYPYISDAAFVTDVGSTKRVIVQALDHLYNGAFMGSHPFAGSDVCGYEHAASDLFKGASIILTPTNKTTRACLSTWRSFWQAIGGICTVMKSHVHDDWAAALSHFPHFWSVLMTNTIARCMTNKQAVCCGATGLNDMSRLAGGSPVVWKEIGVTNTNHIVHYLTRARSELNKMIDLYKEKDTLKLLHYLQRAQSVRTIWQRQWQH